MCRFQRHLASCTVSKFRKVSLAETVFSPCCGWRSFQPKWMCSIAVLRDDLLSSSLSLRSWCRCLRIIYLQAQCLGLIHTQSASTALCRQFINGDKCPQQLSISSVGSLRALETFTWSRATCRSSVTRRTLSSISNSQNFLFRQLCFLLWCFAIMQSLLKPCITCSKFPPEPGV